MQLSKIIDEKKIPEANIGLVGHVAHGKTTLTQALTGKLTLTHSEELKRGITIRLGYADATIYKKDGSYTVDSKAGGDVVRTISLVDAPGHETLMATVLSGASLMDGAILLISAVDKCPQPQTREHLAALEVVGINKVIIVQSKIDLVSKERAMQSYQEIKNFVKGTILESAPIIPVSAQQNINIDSVLAAIQEIVPTPQRDSSKDPLMMVARSFDLNKPGFTLDQINGGTVGGAILQGKLKVGDEIEIRPGIKTGTKYESLFTKIVGMKKAGASLEEAGPGGLLGVMTELDPSLTKSDSLVGNVVGLPGKLPPIIDNMSLQVKMLNRVVGSEELSESKPLRISENLLINVGTARSVGEVTSIKKDKLETKLKIPVCVDRGQRVALSRLIGGRWRLVGYGTTL